MAQGEKEGLVFPTRHTNTKKKRMGVGIKSMVRSISVVSVTTMGVGRWNSKGCQTRVKWFIVRRQKEEVSLAADRGVRDTGEGKRKATKGVIEKNLLIKFKEL
ncbi:hypothetical protein AVEN_176979-1 [Araneus ventricosus]|uniref:Uncharacterized protein n=1 Tax=Araneus ventricosus TaxID=182803 RepID=A0A4Y2LEU5_ARAVE|nr:hypothetical protein AVEN_176979-1 [Araneus ventricosus]